MLQLSVRMMPYRPKFKVYDYGLVTFGIRTDWDKFPPFASFLSLQSNQLCNKPNNPFYRRHEASGS